MTITEKLQAISDVSGGNLFDADYNGGEWMVNAVQTAETVEQFIESVKHYNECSAMKSGTIAGLPFVVWKNVQIRKGDTRRSLAVIDLGEVRFAVDSEMGDYL